MVAAGHTHHDRTEIGGGYQQWWMGNYVISVEQLYHGWGACKALVESVTSLRRLPIRHSRLFPYRSTERIGRHSR